jgi:hypothetical protein
MSEREQNDHLVLISGESATGKTASLKDLKNHEGVMYLNCESGKRVSFKSKFQEFIITDPYQVYEAFEVAETMPEIHTIVVDSLSFMMDLFESVHVLTSANTMSAWGAYQQFFKNLMQQYVAKSSKNVIFTAHTRKDLNESTMTYESKVPVKGALANNGIESYFSVVVSSKKMELKKLKDYSNDMLTITEDDELVGYKHVFQTRLTKETVGERIRSPMGLFSQQETFIDNNTQQLLDHLRAYFD